MSWITDRWSALAAWVLGLSIGSQAALGLSILLCLICMASLARMAKRPADRSLARMTRGPVANAFAILLMFFGVGGAWMSLAPLASAAMAAGVVSPEGSRRTIQHLEGGVIAAIHVHDGDVVEPGTPLVTLQSVRAQGERDALFYEYASLAVAEARLLAEAAGAETFDVPVALAALPDDPQITEIIRAETSLFDTRQSRRRARDAVLESRIAQLQEQVDGQERVIASIDDQLDLLAEEIEATGPLVERGLATRPRLLELQREHAALRGSREEARTAIARSREAMASTRLEIIEHQEEDAQTVGEELADVRARLVRARNLLPSSEDELARTVVTSPIAGVVLQMRFSTIAGVVRPGEPILDIVPADAQLFIEARVRPSDIDDVVTGQAARVILSAYRQRNLPQIHGTVRDVSADRIADSATGKSYYLARVEVSSDEIQRVRESSHVDIELVSGMPAEVMIVTGDRTMFDYLFEPVAASLRRAFRES